MSEGHISVTVADPAIEEMARQFQSRTAVPKAKRVKFRMPTQKTRKGRRQRAKLAASFMERRAVA